MFLNEKPNLTKGETFRKRFKKA
jgi:hypothetical protein